MPLKHTRKHPHNACTQKPAHIPRIQRAPGIVLERMAAFDGTSAACACASERRAECASNAPHMRSTCTDGAPSAHIKPCKRAHGPRMSARQWFNISPGALCAAEARVKSTPNPEKVHAHAHHLPGSLARIRAIWRSRPLRHVHRARPAYFFGEKRCGIVPVAASCKQRGRGKSAARVRAPRARTAPAPVRQRRGRAPRSSASAATMFDVCAAQSQGANAGWHRAAHIVSATSDKAHAPKRMHAAPQNARPPGSSCSTPATWQLRAALAHQERRRADEGAPRRPRDASASRVASARTRARILAACTRARLTQPHAPRTPTCSEFWLAAALMRRDACS
jgi:hypothetical protein